MNRPSARFRRFGAILFIAGFGAAITHAQIADDPWSIAQGRTLVEVDAFYAFDRDAGVSTRAFNGPTLLMSHGLTDRADVQLGFDAYYHDRYRSSGTVSTWQDWGDLTLRAKYTVHGHDDDEFALGAMAFALLPYLKVPLKLGDGGSHQVEGGLILPLALSLPRAWTLVVMTEFDCIADSADRGHVFQWIEALVLSRGFTEKTSGYLEFYSVLPADSAFDWTAQLNIGFYYAFTPEFYIDAGCNFGVTRSAPDYQPFVGLTYLF